MTAGLAAWRARFGLAELAGTIAACAGFAAGRAAGWPIPACAGLATAAEAAAFYTVVGVRTGLAAWQATAHLGGIRRLAAGTWHAITDQLASAVAAEAADTLAVRPIAMAGGAWIARPWVWAGFAAGKLTADAAWYAMEAIARRGMTAAVPSVPAPSGDHLRPSHPRKRTGNRPQLHAADLVTRR